MFATSGPAQLAYESTGAHEQLSFLDGVAHLPHLEGDPATLEQIAHFVGSFA